MAEFFRDAFDGANGATLTAYNAGWVTVGTSGLARLQDGRVYQAGSTAAVYARADVAAPQADYSVLFDLTSATDAGSPSVGACLRMSSNAVTMYQARFQRGTGLVLARFINGATVTIASTPFSIANGETVSFRFEVKGSELSLYIVGATAPILSTTDTLITQAGTVGMRLASANTNMVYLDNMVADTGDDAAKNVYEYAAQGGLVLSGAAALARAASRAASGGAVLSGAASVTTIGAKKVLEVVAAGGIAFAGIARRAATAIRSAAGGATFKGSAGYTNSGVVPRDASIMRRRARPRQPVSRR